MSDIVERLRYEERRNGELWWVCKQAADEIERLREALREIVCDCTDECEQSPIGLSPSSDNCYRFVARAALGEGK